ncbi:MAG: 2-keto-4-pentenoate hydratase [Acetobacteraceae bacterium]|nr:2-keto-4-pentenoate hydratase [Acetobacteraceae bacterium]
MSASASASATASDGAAGVAARAADLLLAARRDHPGGRIEHLPPELRPADQAAAYAIQRRVAASYAAIGGWKVGAPGPDAPPICGPLPSAGIVPSPATLPTRTHAYRGIEAEIAFRMARDLPPRDAPYTREEVIAALGAAHPAIEVLESRFLDPDAIDPLTNLADTQSHGGFVYGAPVADWHAIDFARETVEQVVDGQLHKSGTGNPGGDMIRLIAWLANEGARWAGGLKAGQFVTCGSWTGKAPVGPAAKVRVRFARMGEVSASFAA